ncbi:response regulator [bacterium]|nr:response regulator [bacterium]
MKLNLLLLDDDSLITQALEKALRLHGFQVFVAANGSQALEHARNTPFDLLICDVRMPGPDGLETLSQLRHLQQGLRSIIMTGYASEDAPLRAIQNQVDDYLLKPVSFERLLESVKRSAELCRIEKRSQQALEDMRRRYLRLISNLVQAFCEKDPAYYEHTRRVAGLAVEMGREMGLEANRLEQLEVAALLHDIGMAFVDGSLLAADRELNEEERKSFQERPDHLRRLLGGLPEMRTVLPVLESLYERFDGQGYPGRLRAEQIPLESRILAVAEAYDSLTHDRPHRAALNHAEACEVLSQMAGSQFDPALAGLCCDLAAEQRSLGEAIGQAPGAETASWQTFLKLGCLFRSQKDFTAASGAFAEAEKRLGSDSPPELTGVWAEWAVSEALAGRAEEAQRLLTRLAPQLETLAGAECFQVARAYLLLGRKALARQLIARSYTRARELGDQTTMRNYLTLQLSVPEPESEEWIRVLELWLDLLGEDLEGHQLSLLQWQEVLQPLRTGAQMPQIQQKCQDALAKAYKSYPQLDARKAAVEPNSQPVVQVASTTSALEVDGSVEVRVECLGGFRVWVDGREILSAEWVTRKSQEFFAYLVLQGKPVAAERLALALWPDLEESSKNNLHATASRARRALRSQQSELNLLRSERNFYRLDSNVLLQCDALEIQELFKNCKPNTQNILAPEAIESGSRALNLYQGDLLDGFWWDWASELRRSLKESYAQCLMRLAEHYQKESHWAQAQSLYQRGLEQERTREEFNLGLLQCLAQQGAREAAVRCFRDYARNLKRELGLEPGAEATHLLYRLTGVHA